MSVITTHLFPTSNIQFANYCLKLLLSENLADPTELINQIKKITNAKYVTLTSSARSSLDTIFKALNVSSDDEIILQAFTCSVVPGSILTNRAKPIFADIESQTLNLSHHSVLSKITPHTRGIIYQHTFGSNDGLKEINSIASKNKLFFIEDKAHILDGNPILGDVAVVSFGRTKWISCVFGGCLLTNNKNLHDKFEQIEAQKKVPANSWVTQQLIQSPIIEYLIRPWLGKLKVGELIMETMSATQIMSKEVTQEEKSGKLGNIIEHKLHPKLISLLLFALKQYDSVFATRINAINVYKEQIPDQLRVAGFSDPIPYLYFPILVKDPQSFYNFAKSNGFYPGNWYYPTISPPGTDYEKISYDPRNCPTAEKISLQIVNLPTLVSERQTQKVVKIVNEYHKLYYR